MTAPATPEDIANVIKLLERLRTGEMNLIPGVASIHERKEDASTALLQRVEAVLSEHLRRMLEPLGDGGSAFPEPGLSGLPNNEFIHPNAGMSLRDYFIAHAPDEPQDWFEPVMPTPRPEDPKFPEEHGASRDHASYVREYASVMKPDEAQTPALQKYVEDVQAWRRVAPAWDAKHAKERHLQWPAAWADEMLKRGQS